MTQRLNRDDFLASLHPELRRQIERADQIPPERASRINPFVNALQLGVTPRRKRFGESEDNR